MALMTLGTTELWSLQLADARRHLEQGLTLARRTERPYLEVGCLAHLAIAAPVTGQSASGALDLTKRAVALAEEHGLTTNPIVALAFAIGTGSLAWLGRFDEAERWLERAKRALRPEGDPGTELALYHAQGLLHSGQGRLEDALAAFRKAERMQAMLVGEHALMADLRLRISLTQVRMGAVADARAALDGIPEPERDHAEVRIATAAIHLAEGTPDRAIARLSPLTERSVAFLIPTCAAIHALLFDAAAHEQLGDTCAAEASLERALELAEPEGLILPFTLVSVRGLLERHTRQRSAHPALRLAILDVLAGTSAPPRGKPAPLVDELSEAELRVVRYLPCNLRAPEIAAELFVSRRTRSERTCAISTPSSTPMAALRRSTARQLGLLAPSHRRR